MLVLDACQDGCLLGSFVNRGVREELLSSGSTQRIHPLASVAMSCEKDALQFVRSGKQIAARHSAHGPVLVWPVALDAGWMRRSAWSSLNDAATLGSARCTLRNC